MIPDKKIRLSKCRLGDMEKSAVMSVLDNEYLGMGEKVQEFEISLQSYLGRDSVCVANGTAALHLALEASGIGSGDEVLVPSLTYLASFQAISATGARPIACDIDERNLVIDWRDAEKRVTSATKAIMPVHYSGGVGDIDSLYSFARSSNLRVIEDAAHAFSSRHRGKLVGSFGDIACFSFDGIKNITSGEGGCVVSDDADLMQKIRDIRLLGVERDSEKRIAGKRSWQFDVKNQGWRYHMSDVMAAIGVTQLSKIDELSGARQTLAKTYDKYFENDSRITFLPHDYSEIVPHIYVVIINELSKRDQLRQMLLDRGIETGVHYQPNHELSFYKRALSIPLKVTERIFPRLLSLPLHPDLTDEDISYVVENLHECLKQC